MEFEGNPVLLKGLLKLRGGPLNPLGGIIVGTVETMGGAVYFGKSGSREYFPHGEGLLRIFGTIVYPWQQMTMPVDHSFPSLGKTAEQNSTV
jgi:hypothetical protein